jgi:ABC-type multidrug transport system fused ATPase/permease subunit
MTVLNDSLLSFLQASYSSFIANFLSIIIILEEATASFDAESEALIQKSLSELIKDSTTIVIAHRLSTIKKS